MTWVQLVEDAVEPLREFLQVFAVDRRGEALRQRIEHAVHRLVALVLDLLHPVAHGQWRSTLFQGGHRQRRGAGVGGDLFQVVEEVVFAGQEPADQDVG